ncbi:MAG: hypothetical protein PHV23_01510 [Candidatus Gracilibacteria bacterium]|nr:hypothetical protein [Candidatus Gracilibacteria bacterium]
METENIHNNNSGTDTLSYQELDLRIKDIVENIISKEDINLKKRSVKKLLSFIITLKESCAISPNCISSINLELLQNEDTYKILCEIFIDAANKGEIRYYITLINEFREYFPNIDFIYNSPEIQDAIIKDIEFLEKNRQNISILSKYLKNN